MKSRKSRIINLSVVIVFIFLLYITNGHHENALELSNNDVQDINVLETSESPIPPDSASLIADNLTGIGQARDVLHVANRTDMNIPMRFSNGSSGAYSIPLGENWEGTKLEADLSDVQDYRNWVNGSFDFGVADAIEYNDNDSDITKNAYTTWTFTAYDDISTGYINTMAGNYFDESSNLSRRSLELRQNGYLSGVYHYYDTGDYCQWSNNFSVPRGAFKGGDLRFQAIPAACADFDSWELQVFLDEVMIWKIAQHTFELLHGNVWNDFYIPSNVWINNTNIFNSALNTQTHNLTFRYICIDKYVCFAGSFESKYWQRINIANVSLYLNAEVRPESVNLTMNGHPVTSSTFGVGKITENNIWTGNSVMANFTVQNNSSYSIIFQANLNVFSQKNSPPTSYTPNTDNLGCTFTVTNESSVWWEFYAYFSVPTGYIEENFTLTYPWDWNITWVSNPQESDVNKLSSCTFSGGKLIIPIKEITLIPDGYWHFFAHSTNYITQIQTLKNSSSLDDWSVQNTYIAGEYLNITGSINTTASFTDYEFSSAWLDIRFPNGTIWGSTTQPDLIDNSGHIQFGLIQIPTNGEGYQVGVYQIYVTWNNSYDGFNLNETGIYQTSITILHPSQLSTDSVYIADMMENSTKAITISYYDANSQYPIASGVLVYRNFTNNLITCTEITPPGSYFTEITMNFAQPGNNTITINASHPYYVSCALNITIFVIIKTKLSIAEYPTLNVMYGNNFTLHLSYQRLYSNIGITNAQVSHTWAESSSVSEISNGDYIIDTTNIQTQANKEYSIQVRINLTGYDPQTKFVTIQVSPRTSRYILYINSENKTTNSIIDAPISSIINFTIFYLDSNGTFLSGTQLGFSGIDSNAYNITQIGFQSQILIKTSTIGLGNHFVSITVEKTNYEQISRLLQIKVNKIHTNITTIDTSPYYVINANNQFQTQIRIWDTDFGNNLADCEVTYAWKFGSGNLTESDIPGIYNLQLDQVPEGTYDIMISVYKGPNYAFETYKITVVANAQESALPTWLLYVFGGVVVGLVGIFIKYQTTWKYPKMVRQLREWKKQVKKGKIDSSMVKLEKDVFTEDYLKVRDDLNASKKKELRNLFLQSPSSKNAATGDQKSKAPNNVPSSEEASSIKPNTKEEQK